MGRKFKSLKETQVYLKLTTETYVSLKVSQLRHQNVVSFNVVIFCSPSKIIVWYGRQSCFTNHFEILFCIRHLSNSLTLRFSKPELKEASLIQLYSERTSFKINLKEKNILKCASYRRKGGRETFLSGCRSLTVTSSFSEISIYISPHDYGN